MSDATQLDHHASQVRLRLIRQLLPLLLADLARTKENAVVVELAVEIVLAQQFYGHADVRFLLRTNLVLPSRFLVLEDRTEQLSFLLDVKHQFG